uniref:Uncharacterized protein n=1 Tax=Strongyloides venezuelensis TaxID=75913 RepID=A0A0K0FZT2_STRVS
MSEIIYYRHMKPNDSRVPSGHCHSAETFACSLTGLSHPSLFIRQTFPILSHLEAGLQEPATTPGDGGHFNRDSVKNSGSLAELLFF